MDPQRAHKPPRSSDLPPRRPFVPVPYAPQDHDRIQRLLNKVLGPEYVSSRPGGGGTSVLYIEGWKALNLANEIFGFNGWNSELVSQQVDYIDTHGSAGRFLMGLLVVVRVTIRDGTFHEDFGYGYIDNAKSKAMAFEKCRKEAFTDGIKRCLRCFGNVLGNCLYDRTIISKIKGVTLPKPAMDDTDFYRDVAIYDSERRKRRDTRTSIMESGNSGVNNNPDIYKEGNGNAAKYTGRNGDDKSSAPSNKGHKSDTPTRPHSNGTTAQSRGTGGDSSSANKRHRHQDTNAHSSRAQRNIDSAQDTLGHMHRDPDTQTARELDEMDFSFFSDDVNEEDAHYNQESDNDSLRLGLGSVHQKHQNQAPAHNENENQNQNQNKNLKVRQREPHVLDPNEPPRQSDLSPQPHAQSQQHHLNQNTDPLIPPVAIVSARDAAVVQDLPHAPPAVARFNHHFISPNIRRTIDQSRSGPVRRADIPISASSQAIVPPNKTLPPPRRLGMPPSQSTTTKRLRSELE